MAVAKALRIFCAQDNYPVLIHCIHGKDRTGLIVMLLLLICDVPAKVSYRLNGSYSPGFVNQTSSAVI